MRRIPLAWLAALAFALTPGCVLSKGRRDTPGWLAARGADLMDVVGLRVSLGPGLGLYARATQYVQLGLIKKGQAERALPAPTGGEARGLRCLVFGTIGRYGGAWLESSSEAMIPGWSSRERRRSADSGLAIDREPFAGYVSPHGSEDMWRESFGAGAHLLLAGIEAEVRPFQLLDFLVGIAGYDPAGDDMPASSRSSGPPEASEDMDASSPSN